MSHSPADSGFFDKYMKVFIALLVLTVITVAVSRMHVSAVAHITIAMIVASIKAFLVGAVFMHLKYEKPVIWMYAIFPLILLGIMIGGLFIDNPYRSLPTPVKVIKEVNSH